MRQSMRQRICCLLIQHSSFTKFAFLLYYSHIIRGTTAAMAQRNQQMKNTINGFERNAIFMGKGDSSNLLDDSAEIETATCAQAIKGTIHNLKDNFALIRTYDPPLRIMPLGDSITYGVIGKKDRNSGGYRTELWNKFEADGLKVEFVGSLSSGPDSLGNKNHEGHPTRKIGQIAASVNQWLDTFQPDIVLLTIGTNDTRKNSLRTMLNDLSNLINQINAQLPKAQLLVASIPPIHPSAKHAPLRSIRAMYFNAAIPNIVNSKVAQGKKVHFVDMRSLTVDNLTSSLSLDLDNGLHPNAEGYRKIANFWHDAILKVISDRQVSPSRACY